MALESAIYISQLDPANPSGADRLAQGDDHIRMIKQCLLDTFPNITGPINLTDKFINELIGLKSGLVPVGTITLWYGEEVPEGYALCNGQLANRADGTGKIQTPDLRGRAPVGASTARPLGTAFGTESRTVATDAAGGHTHSASVDAAPDHSHGVTVNGTALSVAQMPAHKHGNGVTDAADRLFNHGILSASPQTPNSIDNNGAKGTNEGYTTTEGKGDPHSHTATIAAGGSHSHATVIGGVVGHSHTAELDVLQPSLSINFIMKV